VSCPVPPSPAPPAGTVTGVFLFHDGSLKNCWYACPSSYILFGGCAFFRLTFPPRLCSLRQPCAVSQCAFIIRTVLTTHLYRRPSSPVAKHRKPPRCTAIILYGGSSGPGHLTSETSRATSSNPSTYRWTSVRSCFVVRLWFLTKCAAACFGTTAVRHSMHVTMRCYCEWTKCLAKTSALGGVGTSIARLICRAIGCRIVGRCYLVGLRMSPRSGYGSTDYMSTPPSVSTYASTYTASDPSLPQPKNSPAASTCDRAAPALVRFRYALHTALGAPVRGRAPRWNTKTDLTPPAAATLSRDPTRFGR
jgi:hypothetical protein